MKLGKGNLLLAMAQVFEDYPDRWTKGTYARTAKGTPVDSWSRNAHAFCAEGFLARAQAEGLADRFEVNQAHAFLKHYAGDKGVAYVNDNKGREAIIALARKAAHAILHPLSQGYAANHSEKP